MDNLTVNLYVEHVIYFFFNMVSTFSTNIIIPIDFIFSNVLWLILNKYQLLTSINFLLLCTDFLFWSFIVKQPVVQKFEINCKIVQEIFMLKAIKHILKCCKLYRDSADLHIEVVSLDQEITGTAEARWEAKRQIHPPHLTFCRNRKEDRSRIIQSSITVPPPPRFLDLPPLLNKHGKFANCNFLHLHYALEIDGL